jgi:carboxypeptidase C (cathepsin A)
MNARIIVALLCLGALLGAGTAPPAHVGLLQPLDGGDAVTQHSVTIGGRVYAYTARAGTLVVDNAAGKPAARMFYTADTVDSSADSRPITFAYNGGPGSSTMWLRMGSFGPVRVVAGNGEPSGPAPYSIVDNQYSLLDKTDLVFVDAPDTGFGRILPGGTPKDFFGTDPDVAAFAQFIERYLTKFHRWNSPKFIYGESYGTTRSAALAKALLDKGIALNGIVLQSSILNFGLSYGNGEPNATGDWAYVFYLPTEAATAWYHDRIPNKPDLATFVGEVENFATGEYMDALFAGARLPNARRNAIARKLSYYLGIPQNFALEADLRISYDRFQRELMRQDGIVVGRLDSRYTTYGLHEGSNEGPSWDPTDSSIDAPYTTAVNAYLRDDLRYDTTLEYRTNIYGIISAKGAEWDLTHNKRAPVNVAPDLAEAMTQNPSLKVFSANGYFDFATPFFATVYTLQHLELASPLQSNVTVKFYPTGHMIYLSEPALAQYKADLSSWYDSALGR